MSELLPDIEQAVALHQQGRLDEAERIYRQILTSRPQDAQARQLLGLVAYQRGNLVQAAELIEAAIREQPDEADFHNNLGEVYRALGRVGEAALCYERALRLEPAYAHAHNNLGLARKAAGDRVAARLAFQAALRLEPGYAEAWTNLGVLEQEQGNLSEAILCFERAVTAQPGFALGHSLRGRALRKIGRREEAVAELREAVRLAPDSADAHYFLGLALRESSQLSAAAEQFSRSIELRPGFPEAYVDLGICAREMGRAEQVVDCFRQAMTLAPGAPLVHSNLLFATHYLPGLTPAKIAAEHQCWSERHAGMPGDSVPAPTGDRRLKRRLRVGYVSPDFREHSVARFLLPLLENHRSEAFETYAYAAVDRSDVFTERFKQLAGAWRDISKMTDAQAAEQIRQDGIDMLVDLAGHTANNRLPIFARKPAPIQLTYLGYPNTTGLASIDYRIVDGWSDPEGITDPHYAEKLWRLPETAWCYRPLESLPEPEPSPRLAAGRVAFGSFNILAKMSAKSVELWAAVLREVPHATLVLKSKGLADAAVCREVAARFERLGVAGERLIFAPWTKTVREHLEHYREVDVALDTFPYHGTTTTCDALWMGVPVVTLAGDMHHSRVGVSLLTHVGRPELIAKSPEEFVRIAVELANAPERLGKMRMGLRAQMAVSPLRNEVKFARQFEAALTAMWERKTEE